MSPSDLYYPSRDREGSRSWLGRAEDWLDDRGKGAWIALTIVGFVAFWPAGLALLAYMIWSKRMFSHSHSHGRSMACGWGRGSPEHEARMMKMRSDRMAAWKGARTAMRPSGNAAFDAYKSDTLRRLEEEQVQFEEFLARLREAKDKAEFDQFMEDRARRADDRTGGEPSGDASNDSAV